MACSKGYHKKLDEFLDSENFNKSNYELFSHYQECKRYKGLITWTLKKSDLNINQFGNSKESVGFSIGSPDFCKLLLRLFPSGKTESTKEFVSLSVCFKSKLPINSCYQCTISFVNEAGKILKSDEKSGEGIDLNLIDFDCFTLKDKLPEFIVNNKLIIQIALKICCKSFYCKSGDTEFTIKESHEEKPPTTKMLDNLPYHDVIFEDKEKKEIKSCKALLASEATVFRIVFKSAPEHEKKFNFKIGDATLFKEMLHFIYTGNIWFRSFKHACEVYELASLYQIQKLKLFCSAYIGVHLCEENIYVAQIIAHKYEDKDLLRCCFEFIQNFDLKKLSDSSILSHHDKLK